MAPSVANENSFSTCDHVSGGEDDSVGGDKRAGADASSLIILNLDEGTGDFWIEVSDAHAIGSEHGGERAGERVPQLTRSFERTFGLGEFSLVKKAASEDALNLWVLRGDEESKTGGFFGFGVATGEVEGASFQFPGFGVVFIPPEGLGSGDEGAVVAAGRPKFFFLRKSEEREKSGKEEKREFHAVSNRR